MKIKSPIPTPHIQAEKTQIAKVVIMAGDPLRAKYIAVNFLTAYTEVNNIRNMLMYTGKYKGYHITVAGSGMGMPSIGIYSYELFKFYDVDCIIRVGSAGSYQKDIKVFDLINVTQAYSESTYAKIAINFDQNKIGAGKSIYEIINKTATKIDSEAQLLPEKINLKTGLIHSSDVFYRHNRDEWKDNPLIKACLAVEMESFALFANAQALAKNAACLLTISDSLVTNEAISAKSRETCFKKMMILALESAIAYYEVSM